MSEMMDLVKKVSENMAQYVEEFAAAFAKRTGLNPTEIKMVSAIRGNKHEIWFEPFPADTDIEMYRRQRDDALAELSRLKEENHALDQVNRDIQTAAAHLDEILEELNVLHERTRWIPVSEKLPGYNDRVITLIKDEIYDGFMPGAEYWMYRPELPEEK